MRCQTIQLQVLFIKEGETFIAFSPALDISTCANTSEKAQKRFEELVEVFLGELEKMGTMDEVLTDLGWKKEVRDKKPSWIPPFIINKMNENFTIPCRV